MLALAVVASTNRDSSVFLTLLWGLVAWNRVGATSRTMLQACALGGVSVATVLGLRVLVGGPRALAGPAMPLGNNVAEVLAFLRHPGPLDWPVGLGALVVLAAAAYWPRRVTADQWAMIAVAVLMAALSALGGAVEELRIYVPAVTVAIVASATAHGHAA